MHDQNVAHRWVESCSQCTADDQNCSDCGPENILMDGSKLYKNGWHPMETWKARDGGVLFFSRQRSEVEIKYYFIDFGLSTEFASGHHERLVTGQKGRIEAPEQSSGSPYDPFKLDVYYLGHVYQTKIVDVRFLYFVRFWVSHVPVGVQRIRGFGRSRPIDDKARSKGPSYGTGNTDDLEESTIASVNAAQVDQTANHARRGID